MIATIRKRFDPPLGTRKPEKVPEDEKVLVEGIHVETPGVMTPVNGGDYMGSQPIVLEKGARTLKVEQAEVRNRSTKRPG